MSRIAFLTMESLAGWSADDHLAVDPLRRRGWAVESVAWRGDVEWDRFDAVVIRSTWDYFHHLDSFLRVLERIGASRARLLNPLEVVRWNARKEYLRDLEARGVPVVPTRWGSSPGEAALAGLFGELRADEIVVKPAVSANAAGTYRLRRDTPWSVFADVASALRGRDYLAQPFVRGVVDEGEFSVVLFCGEPSHTVLKTPRGGDFRVQEEHGGLIRAVTPEPALLAAARAALAAAGPAPLYARADLVRVDGGFALMELELIEPSLYLRTDADAPERFAAAIDLFLRAPDQDDRTMIGAMHDATPALEPR
jgi:glutathione synthase/RimK-type ligase-like ATP-grasp enzyme